MTKDFQAYAHSFQVFPKLGLTRIRALLTRLGDPQKTGCYYHVAGTNGKGSVSVALAAMLTAGGRKTGLYTSPNLVRVNERIAVDGTPISDDDLAVLLGEVEAACAAVAKETKETPTPFEIWTAAAFLWFARQKCDAVVLEVGLGGEFDATNVIEHCETAVLTHIDYDHTAQLGTTLAAIAQAKCGIIKPGCRVLTVPQHPEVMAEIRSACAKKGATLCVCEPPPPARHSGFYEVVDLPGLPETTLPFCGMHQIENCALAVACATQAGLDGTTVRRGLAAARHPGRMELLRRDPPLLYDGGHNPNGISALVASLARYAPGMRFTVIFAAMRDKEIAPSLAMLSEVSEGFIFTSVCKNPRAMTPEELTDRAKEAGICGAAAPSLSAALEAAGNRPTLVCGSLYLYADLPPKLRSL